MSKDKQGKDRKSTTPTLSSFHPFFSAPAEANPQDPSARMATGHSTQTRNTRSTKLPTQPMEGLVEDWATRETPADQINTEDIRRHCAGPSQALPFTGLMTSLPPELQALISLLPSKADFEALATRLESTLREDIGTLQQTTAQLTERVDSMESWSNNTDRCIEQLERDRDRLQSALLHSYLHIEDLEDRSLRNNIRVRGLPEAFPAVHL